MRSASIRSIVTMAVAWALAAGFTADAQDRPRIAVLKFIASQEASEEADAIAEEVRTAFVKSQRFTVVDRTLTDKIFEELAFQQTGATEQDNTVRVGKMFTVRRLVTGKLNKFASGGWQVSAVVLDAESGTTLAAETVRYRGDFFTLLNDQVPTMSRVLLYGGGNAAAPTAPIRPGTKPVVPGTPLPTAIVPIPGPSGPERSVIFFPAKLTGVQQNWADRRDKGDATIFSAMRAGIDEAKINTRMPNDGALVDAAWTGFLTPKPNDAYIIAKSRELKADLAVIYRSSFGASNHFYGITLYDVATGTAYSREGAYTQGEWIHVLNSKTAELVQEYQRANPVRR